MSTPALTAAPTESLPYQLDSGSMNSNGVSPEGGGTMNFSISGIVGANAAACACAAAAEQSRCAAPDWEHAQCACLRPHAHPGERERARADSFEALSRVQAASLAELGDLAHNVRCQVADLADDALSSKPMPVHGLRNVTGRMNGLAETLSRAARGYAGARTTVMLYPDVVDDLRTHKWTPRPDQGLDGVLPPVPIIELRDRRGYARGTSRLGLDRPHNPRIESATSRPRLGGIGLRRHGFETEANQRRYEALRAYLFEGVPAAQAAARFGYTTAALQSLVRDFRAGRCEFFLTSRPGPKTAPAKDAARARIIELR